MYEQPNVTFCIKLAMVGNFTQSMARCNQRNKLKNNPEALS